MSRNVGTIDRIIRIFIGLVLIAFAIRIVAPHSGWNWTGWIGIVPLITGLLGMSPTYKFLGFSTCSARPHSSQATPMTAKH